MPKQARADAAAAAAAARPARVPTINATPGAIAKAAKLGVDLSRVSRGTGKGGKIILRDVAAARTSQELQAIMGAGDAATQAETLARLARFGAGGSVMDEFWHAGNLEGMAADEASSQ